MSFSLHAAAVNICHRIGQEYVREGDPRPVVTWTGEHELRGKQLWIEVKIHDDYAATTGWTNGEQEHGFIQFQCTD